ncbi:hypothetical protein ACSBR1_009663 [Camellia fascicularis]
MGFVLRTWLQSSPCRGIHHFSVLHNQSEQIAGGRSSGSKHKEMLRNSHQEVSKNGTGDSLQGCNLFSGKCVYDDKSFPLYKELECSFIDDGMTCKRFGRKDFNYQHWRWQPHDCNLPRFNAIAMLEKLRGKKLVFVGDSLNRNPWASMVCVVQSPIPFSLKSMTINGSLISFKAIVS